MTVFVCGDIEFDTLEMAVSYSNYIYDKQGLILGIEKVTK
jgi:hypothetical protein